MSDLNEQKLKALSSVSSEDQNERYNIPKEKLQVLDHNMKNITRQDQIKEVGNYKTRKRTNKEYSALWDIFKDRYADDYEKYMGYGVKTIEKIGVKEFIDFMDWSCEDDIQKYKTDRVKVIPCVNCGCHFTTFQIDLGLCSNCVDLFDMKKFSQTLEANEAKETGSSAGTQIMFVYIEEFRNLYRKDRDLKTSINDAIQIDGLSGYFSRDILVNDIIGKNEDYFIVQCDKYKEKNEVSTALNNRIESITTILKSSDSTNNKVERIKNIF